MSIFVFVLFHIYSLFSSVRSLEASVSKLSEENKLLSERLQERIASDEQEYVTLRYMLVGGLMFTSVVSFQNA